MIITLSQIVLYIPYDDSIPLPASFDKRLPHHSLIPHIFLMLDFVNHKVAHQFSLFCVLLQRGTFPNMCTL